jgi:DNA helicase-2/ATP-dependent DNA helicase PcrA
MNLDNLLNPKQKEAATYLDGHLRIIAGAGSGKTRVVTYRIAYLIEEIGVNPRNILAITFTNKAANEMKERVEKILGASAFGATICTIHSLCVRVLRQHASLLGYPHNFIIMDEEDQKALIKKLFKEKEISSKSLTVKSMINYISSYKIAMISPDRALKMSSIPIEKTKAEIYQLYEDYNKSHAMMDFDDLLLNTLRLFQDNEDVVEKWSRRYQFVHVDEFQDVGEIEYQLIHYFGKQSTVCVVGDPDQTIYSFRGSDVNFILNFDKDYENVKTVILDQNYRSTKTILEISNNLIRKNKNRLEKDLFTEGEDGSKVVHYVGKDEASETHFITNTILDLVNKGEAEYRDFCILYRANYLSRPIEQDLISKNMPYKIFGGLKFFSRKEVKDALSYLRLVVSNDDLSFERIVNVPSRGVGAKTLEKIQMCAIDNHLSNYEALCFYSDAIGIGGKAKKELKNFVQAIEKARASIKSVEEMYDDLMKDTGYLDMLKNNNEESRIDNLMELKNSIATYMREHPENATLEEYLQDIALYTTQDDATSENYISLMSIHMAKGLEFDYVFVTGMSENIFPSIRSIEEEGDDGIEEERRLAYVAFTRAKKRLYLTDSQGYSFVSQSPKMTSRFINEVGRDFVEHVGTPSRFKTENYIKVGETPEEMIGDNEVGEWKNGDLVEHSVFGKGVVIGVHERTVDIAFNVPHGIKTLMSNHKALKRLAS